MSERKEHLEKTVGRLRYVESEFEFVNAEQAPPFDEEEQQHLEHLIAEMIKIFEHLEPNSKHWSQDHLEDCIADLCGLTGEQVAAERQVASVEEYDASGERDDIVAAFAYSLSMGRFMIGVTSAGLFEIPLQDGHVCTCSTLEIAETKLADKIHEGELA